ncbi:plasmid pRiA4b ORF-3 family protein [Aquipuribacter sp. MA13-6]|uniref:plasmid pRiA4b ORF-3 family protein n=1 Tax=unclassified Aquipuribacter TaxID=2635084 RepID=UPI003EE82668
MSHSPDEEQRRRAALEWNRTIDRADPDQILAMMGDGRLAEGFAAIAARPRHPRRDVPVRYLVRVGMPLLARPVVRVLDLPSDMFLDEVSDVVQAAFGWHGYHLHRFAIGDPFAEDAEAYLCPFEVDDGEPGVDARGVRLDELLGEPGEACTYAYDYGDGWEVHLRLRDVRPAEPGEARVRCLGGEGASPPEDCGGADGYEELVVERATYDGRPFDPDAFDPDETTRDILMALRFRQGSRPSVRLERYQWLLERVSSHGLELTAAGHLRPADVRAAFEAWGLGEEWIGAGNREAWTLPVLEVRTGAMSLKLLRRYKGRLLLTRLGAQARRDPEVLRAQLDRLVD